MVAGLPRPLAVKDYGTLRDEYQLYCDMCETWPPFKGHVAYYLKEAKARTAVLRRRCAANRRSVGFVGVIHGMECGFDFGAHLRNSDWLTARTVQVPAGRPASGCARQTTLVRAAPLARLRPGDQSVCNRDAASRDAAQLALR